MNTFDYYCAFIYPHATLTFKIGIFMGELESMIIVALPPVFTLIKPLAADAFRFN